ncbi:hypothetical protein MUCCIDRAFT_108497 [Mucor lusitanicus CBS 277.49]|uniref:Uncharacterized protein n=1 Tax=Mucor lusitanicus CBS 277.49 TaxID=747725 RepID=A0A168MBF4_MUCCL|nr:hypothetical protein MUCCIDRAFT_108497 [Mucor lusitanicus CBS 277.49]
MIFFKRQEPQPQLLLQQHPAVPEDNSAENNDASPNDFNLRTWAIDLATDLRDVLYASCLLARSILRVLDKLLSGIIHLTKYQLGLHSRD